MEVFDATDRSEPMGEEPPQANSLHFRKSFRICPSHTVSQDAGHFCPTLLADMSGAT